jgi:ribonuclease III
MPRQTFSLTSFLNQLNLSSNKLVEQAFTHKSCSKDDPKLLNNERLEFLGDAVLKLVFSEYLSDNFPDEDEGNLSKFRARLISDALLAELALEMGLGKFLHIGRMLKGQKVLPASIYGNALEALIAVIYKEAGYDKAREFILSAWKNQIKRAITESIAHNYKALLIEKIQATYSKAPIFETVSISGEAHERSFEVAVLFDGEELSRGSGKSKKEAGQNAAKAALDRLSF